jgi:hypothetical protein
MAYTMSAGELTAGFGLLGRLNILIRYKVVKDNGNSVLIKHLVEARLFKLIYCNGGGNIVTQNNIKVCAYKLTCSYTFKTRMGG